MICLRAPVIGNINDYALDVLSQTLLYHVYGRVHWGPAMNSLCSRVSQNKYYSIGKARSGYFKMQRNIYFMFDISQMTFIFYNRDYRAR